MKSILTLLASALALSTAIIVSAQDMVIDPEDVMLPREYAREALKRGLKYEEKLGANPFKFGMVGSTDTHTSLSTTEENNFFGKATPAEPGIAGSHLLPWWATNHWRRPARRCAKDSIFLILELVFDPDCCDVLLGY